ncbi:GFA family protein [Dongia sedimenti]|uniref:GFA family protein n=1 Tax=Dongia sedimenti TaxID=3064282 RepID=A0ABU0YGP8_9PROT|nr:GFA family protein [Rhodospirillaceae bacterium R-7]
MVHQGSCHCGRVTFEVEGALTAALSCNCSICSKKAALLWALPKQQVRFQSGLGDLGRYTFNRHVIAHRFCTTCGIHTHGEDAGETAEPNVYINIRCLEGVDLGAIPLQHFDGRSF